MTGESAPDPREAVIAAHWSYEPTKDFDGWLCECGAQIMGREGDTDVAMQGHLAAVLAALDATASKQDTTDPDGLTEAPDFYRDTDGTLYWNLRKHPPTPEGTPGVFDATPSATPLWLAARQRPTQQAATDRTAIEALVDLTDEEANAVDRFMDEHMYHHRHVGQVYAMGCDVHCRTQALAEAFRREVLVPRRAAIAAANPPADPRAHQ